MKIAEGCRQVGKELFVFNRMIQLIRNTGNWLEKKIPIECIVPIIDILNGVVEILGLWNWFVKGPKDKRCQSVYIGNDVSRKEKKMLSFPPSLELF